jgi:hypothetical protein
MPGVPGTVNILDVVRDEPGKGVYFADLVLHYEVFTE